MHRSLTQDPFTQFRRNFFEMTSPKPQNQTTLKVNVYEDGERYLVRSKIPGFDISEVEITAVKNQITIRGERKNQELNESERLHRQERIFMNFERTFSLPKTVNVETIHANFKNGFLELVLDWDEAAKPKNIKIQQGEV